MIARFISRRALLADRFLYATPAGLGLEAEEVGFRSRGGGTLRGWLLRGRKRGTIVFCPGNAGNVSSHLEYLRIGLRTGYSVLGFDYRGFGRSDGEADLSTIVHDVEAACEFTAVHTREPYALFGLSLGAGAAVAAAGRAAADAVAVVVDGVCDIHGMLRGLFSVGSFGPVWIGAVGRQDGSLAERSRGRLVKMRLPVPAARLIARLCATRYRFEGKSPASLAARLGTKPVLLVHGVEDEILPFEAAIELHDQLAGPKRLWLVPGIGHAQEPALACGLEYSAQLEGFLGCAFAGAPPLTPAVRVAALPAPHPATGCMRARLALDSTGAAPGPPGPVLLSAVGGGVLRQVQLEGLDEAVLEFPGPIERVFTLRVLCTEPDAGAARYVSEGYRTVFRAMVQAANGRDLVSLDAALEAHMRLGRAHSFDFFAALYCLRGAQAALGVLPSWPARDGVVARRCLERFLLLWTSNPALPGEDVAESPARWVHEQLARATRA